MTVMMIALVVVAIVASGYLLLDSYWLISSCRLRRRRLEAEVKKLEREVK